MAQHSFHFQNFNPFTASGMPNNATFNIHIPIIFNVFMPTTMPGAQVNPQQQFNASHTSSSQQGATMGGQERQNYNQIPFSFFTPFLSYPNVQMGGSGVGGNNYSYPGFFNFNDILQTSFQQQQQQGPPPVKKEIIARLPVFKFNSKRANLLKHCTLDSCTSCAICQSEFEVNEDLVQLPCQHCYHKDCCMPWIQKHNTCPICRFEMEVEDADKEKQRRRKMEQAYGGSSRLRIMEIASYVTSEYTCVEALLEKETANKDMLVSALKKIDAKLEAYALELDKLGELQGKVKEDRRRVHLMIQEIQKEIDETVAKAQFVDPDAPIVEDDVMNVQ